MAHLDIHYVAPVAVLTGAMIVVLLMRFLVSYGQREAVRRTARMLARLDRDRRQGDDEEVRATT